MSADPEVKYRDPAAPALPRAASREPHPASLAVRDQLERILASPAFCNSRRYSDFLKFVVERTLDGEGANLKERTIGIEVFQRDANYDTNSDHIVRSAASEVRRRLAQYYQGVKDNSEIVIEVRSGSYLPHFAAPPESSPPSAVAPAQAEPTESTLTLSKTPRWWRRGTRLILAAVALAAAAALLLLGWSRVAGPAPADEAFHRFWDPVLAGHGPVLLCIGGERFAGSESSRLDDLRAMTHQVLNVEDAIVLAKLSAVVQSIHKPWRILTEPATTFADLKEGPAILIGAFNNEWSLRMISGLRFQFERDPNQPRVGLIRDTVDPTSRSWAPTLTGTGGDARSGYVVTRDFALVSRTWNSDTRQFVVIAAGITGYGTTSAGDFLSNPAYLSAIETKFGSGAVGKNFQIVLATEVIRGVPGPPIPIIFHSW